MTYTVRTAVEDDWQVLRWLRLEALEDAPDAFETTHAQALRFDDRWWRARARGTSNNRLFLALLEGEAVGMAGAVSETEDDWEVISMWVRRGHRGRGVGDLLVDAAVGFAAQSGATQVRLWVTEDNAAAQRLYQRMGFRLTGRRQPVPGKEPPAYEREMARRLE